MLLPRACAGVDWSVRGWGWGGGGGVHVSYLRVVNPGNALDCVAKAGNCIYDHVE